MMEMGSATHLRNIQWLSAMELRVVGCGEENDAAVYRVAVDRQTTTEAARITQCSKNVADLITTQPKCSKLST